LAAGCLYFAVVKAWNSEKKKIKKFQRNWDNIYAEITKVSVHDMKTAFKEVRKALDDGEKKYRKKTIRVPREYE